MNQGTLQYPLCCCCWIRLLLSVVVVAMLGYQYTAHGWTTIMTPSAQLPARYPTTTGIRLQQQSPTKCITRRFIDNNLFFDSALFSFSTPPSSTIRLRQQSTDSSDMNDQVDDNSSSSSSSNSAQSATTMNEGIENVNESTSSLGQTPPPLPPATPIKVIDESEHDAAVMDRLLRPFQFSDLLQTIIGRSVFVVVVFGFLLQFLGYSYIVEYDATTDIVTNVMNANGEIISTSIKHTAPPKFRIGTIEERDFLQEIRRDMKTIQ